MNESGTQSVCQECLFFWWECPKIFFFLVIHTHPPHTHTQGGGLCPQVSKLRPLLRRFLSDAVTPLSQWLICEYPKIVEKLVMAYEAWTHLQACRTGVRHDSDTNATTTRRTRVSEVCPALPLQFLNSKPSDMAANRSNFFLQWWLTPSGQLQASLYSLFSHRLCALCYAFVNCNVKKYDFSFDYLAPFPSVFDFTSCLTL